MRGEGERNEEKNKRIISEMKRKGVGERTCLHASNLLMVMGKHIINHYLSKTFSWSSMALHTASAKASQSTVMYPGCYDTHSLNKEDDKLTVHTA